MVKASVCSAAPAQRVPRDCPPPAHSLDWRLHSASVGSLSFFLSYFMHRDGRFSQDWCNSYPSKLGKWGVRKCHGKGDPGAQKRGVEVGPRVRQAFICLWSWPAGLLCHCEQASFFQKLLPSQKLHWVWGVKAAAQCDRVESQAVLSTGDWP